MAGSPDTPTHIVIFGVSGDDEPGTSWRSGSNTAARCACSGGAGFTDERYG